MKRKPIGDRILVRRGLPETETESGLYIPGTAQEAENCGVVLAVGSGHINTRNEGGTYIPLQVKEGDVVEFTKFGGVVLKEADAEESARGLGDLIILREADIHCVLYQDNEM